MVHISRKWFMRLQAIEALELTKGFTPEQRAQFSNSGKTLEEFANFILELTNDLDDDRN
jgi:hypothetical protein